MLKETHYLMLKENVRLTACDARSSFTSWSVLSEFLNAPTVSVRLSSEGVLVLTAEAER